MRGGDSADSEVRFGRYELVELIGEGRTAEVFLAHSHGVEGFRRTVAVRRLKPEVSTDEAYVAQWLDRSRLRVLLSHANIVQVLDLGEVAGRYFLAEEYIEGYDLHTLRNMARQGLLTVPAPIGLYLLSEVVKGLEFGHRRVDPSTLAPLGLCHGDLHPRNLLLSYEGAVKLSGFGQVPAPGPIDEHDPDAIERAFSYAAPEVAAGEPPSQVSDLFSLGLLTLEICAGRHPYAGTPAEVRERALRGEIEPGFVATVPETLQSFIRAALRHRAGDRVVDLRALTDRIVSYLHRETDDVGVSALGELVRQVGDLDLRAAVIQSGIFTTDHSMRLKAVSVKPSAAEPHPDAAPVWASGSTGKQRAPDARLVVDLPDSSIEPLGLNGREAELAALGAEVGPQGGRVRVVLLSGPRGIGKSHLLTHAVQALRADGVPAVLVRPDLDCASRPYGTLLDLLGLWLLGRPLLWLEAPGRTLTEALDVHGLGDAQSRETAGRLLELVGYRTRSRRRLRGIMLRLLADLLASTTGTGPFTILLDGPERADPLSLELLHEILVADRPGPLRLVVAGLNQRLLNQLGRAAGEDRRASLVLPALEPGALRRLLERVSGRSSVDDLAVVAEGIPSRAIEVGLAARCDRFEGRRPDALEPLLAALGARHARVLTALGLAETSVPEDHLAALVGIASRELSKVTRQLASLHLITRDPHQGDGLAARSLIEPCRHLLTPAERDRLDIALAYRVAHQHRGATMLNRPFRVRLKAHGGARTSAFTEGRRTASALVQNGFCDVALSFLDQLAALAEGPVLGAPTEGVELRLDQVQVALLAMRLVKGREILARLPARAEELGHEAGMIKALAQQVRMGRLWGDLGAARLALQRLTSTLDPATSPEARALAGLAIGEWKEDRGHLAEARHQYYTAWALLQDSLSAPLILEDICLRLASVLVRRGEGRLAERVVRLASRFDDPAIATVRRRVLGLRALFAGRAHEAATELAEAFEDARRRSRAAASLSILPELIEALIQANDLDGARQRIEVGMALTDRYADDRTRRRLKTLRHLEQGRRDPGQARQASSALLRSVDEALATEDPNLALEAAWARWRIEKDLGDGQAAAQSVADLAHRIGDWARLDRLTAE